MAEQAAATPVAPAVPAEPHLGVADTGIFSDVDDQVQVQLGPVRPAGPVRGLVAHSGQVLVLYADEWPIKVYPLGGPANLVVGETTLALRPGDKAELEPLLTAGSISRLPDDETVRPGDRDRDGIPDPLDILVGGKKTVIDGAPYGGGYILIDYPGGDIPRDQGVCTDVIIRAVRNAGMDLQHELQRDIRRSRSSYPMVKRPNAHIDHRRVKTLLPYFVRTWDRRRVELDDPSDPLLPGDVVFMDTFPQKSGPDHIGIVSEVVGDSGHPLIINSWTDGFQTSEMDLLGFVPVTHRFRFPSR